MIRSSLGHLLRGYSPQELAEIILGRQGSIAVLRVQKSSSSVIESVALERFENDEEKMSTNSNVVH